MPSSRTLFHQAHREAITTTRQVQTATAADAVTTAGPKALEAERKKDDYVTVSLLRDEKPPVPAPAADGKCTLHFINRVSVAE